MLGSLIILKHWSQKVWKMQGKCILPLELRDIPQNEKISRETGNIFLLMPGITGIFPGTGNWTL